MSVAQSAKTLASNSELRSGAGSIPTWADYLVFSEVFHNRMANVRDSVVRNVILLQRFSGQERSTQRPRCQYNRNTLLLVNRWARCQKNAFVLEVDAGALADCGRGTSTRNQKGHARPKHRGWRVQDGHYVQAGTILATQRNLRFHPGLNVGFGKNGTLFAIEAGRVYVTCEKADPNWEHTWIMRHYEGRDNETIYKKYFNVIPEPQEFRFKLIDRI
ncbi:hypothetical protein ANN_24145 [Periplaneta americana]|uniref:Ribosomal protein L27 n=1 Tax=Periplaneta americana TaxID=6978 RepID=A0ABQ8S2K2_PERAM|nr:hypothetical protein ANN_24145 [Periplaneta americana]